MKISLSQTTAVISNVPATPEGAIVVIKDRVDRTTEIENAVLIQTRFSNRRSRGNKSDLKYINKDPALMPSIAMLIAKKARWDHRITEMRRVSTIWSIRPHEHIKNTPLRNGQAS